MEPRCECSACNSFTDARRPNRAFYGLIVAFWAASLLLGFGASRAGWSFVLVAAWAALASSVVLLARRATSWTCAECGSTLAPPVNATNATNAMNATNRAMQHRHA